MRAGLGVTVLNSRHIEPGFDIVTGHFPPPPKLAYIVRTGPKARNATIMALIRIAADEPGWDSGKDLGKATDMVKARDRHGNPAP